MLLNGRSPEGWWPTTLDATPDRATKRRLRPSIRRSFQANLRDLALDHYRWIAAENLIVGALATRQFGG